MKYKAIISKLSTESELSLEKDGSENALVLLGMGIVFTLIQPLLFVRVGNLIWKNRHIRYKIASPQYSWCSVLFIGNFSFSIDLSW